MGHMIKCEIMPLVQAIVLFKKLWTAFIPDTKWVVCAFNLVMEL